MNETITTLGERRGARLHLGLLRWSRPDGGPGCSSIRAIRSCCMRATTPARRTPRRPLPKAEAIVVGDLATIAADQGRRRPSQRAWASRRGHSQRRSRLPRRSSRHQRQLAACLRHQHACALYPDRADRKAEAARLSELGHARSRGREISTISYGASGAGTGRRLTPKASCTTSCWLSPSRACGRMSYRTR